jgi:hypothetical protein
MTMRSFSIINGFLKGKPPFFKKGGFFALYSIENGPGSGFSRRIVSLPVFALKTPPRPSITLFLSPWNVSE